jgi:hypothetical protein
MKRWPLCRRAEDVELLIAVQIESLVWLVAEVERSGAIQQLVLY